jgi:hypothetical protein
VWHENAVDNGSDATIEQLGVDDGAGGMRIDRRGNLYTTSGGAPHRIQITSPEGTHEPPFGGA